MAQKKKTTGRERFIEYYKKFFSSNKEMGKFLSDLENKTTPILRFHPEVEEVLKTIWKKEGLPWKTLKWYPYALEWPKGVPPKTMLPGANEHLFYPMNASSLLPVLALEIKGDELVLDACAAPGGKALFISELLGKDGKLVANDSSFDRVRRMRGVFKDHRVENAEVWSKPGATIFQKYPDHFDKILVDAPCSAEKHVWNSKYLNEWTPRRVKDNSYRQIALLSGLFLALKPGGRMVYSTCAFTPEENEMVVEKLLKKKKDDIRLIKYNLKTPGQSGLGGVDKVWRVYPEKNMDPMFVAVFEKRK